MTRVITFLAALITATATTANAAIICEVQGEDRRFIFSGDSAIIEDTHGDRETTSTLLSCLQVDPKSVITCGHREGNSQTVLSVVDDKTFVLTLAGFLDVTFAPVSVVYRDVICKEA